MKSLLLAMFSATLACASLTADEPPPYIKVQIESLDQQLEQLQLTRQQLEKQLKSSQGFQKQQIQSQIDQVDSQIKFRQDQKKRLLGSGN